MKNLFTNQSGTFNTRNLMSLVVILGILILPITLSAQRVIQVPSGSLLNDVINGDTTATGERVDDNTIYELERNGIYEVSSPLALNVKLHIRGAEGDGFLPSIFPKQTDTGFWPQVIMTRGDLTLENLYISNQNGNVNKWGGIQALGNKSRVEVRNCQIEWDRAAALLLNADSISCFIEDVTVSKLGNRNVYQGNGRFVDTRGKYVDTLVIRNSTFYYLSDRVIRNMGGTIKYFEFDHNTGFHIQGRHGCFQLATVHTAKVTNNLIINPLYGGNHSGTEEQTQPDSQNFYLVTIDQIVEGQVLEIRNNNFVFEPEIISFWETLPDVSKPEALEPLVIQAIGQEAVADAVFEELVSLGNIPPVPMDFLEGIYQNPSADVQPENQDIDVVGINNIDASYSSDYTSYTAADRGFPVGDLNHFPDLKELWLSGESVSVNSLNQPGKISIKAFPNPVTSHTSFAFELDKPEHVSIKVYSINGQLVAQVFEGMALPGLNTISWSAKTAGGNELPSGIYVYKFISKEKTSSDILVIK